MNWTKSGIALVAATLLSANAWAGEGPSGHSHGHGDHGNTFSAGEPGNPNKPAKIVKVTMGESDGKMLFVPARLEVKKGDQIKFVLRNNGRARSRIRPGKHRRQSQTRRSHAKEPGHGA